MGRTPQFRGGFADVWKSEYHGQEVAVKVLRIYSTSDSERFIRVGCLRLVVRIAKLTVPHAEILQGGYDMEGPSASKCIATAGCDNDRQSARDGIRVDAKR
jgi:hypothetical protein